MFATLINPHFQGCCSLHSPSHFALSSAPEVLPDNVVAPEMVSGYFPVSPKLRTRLEERFDALRSKRDFKTEFSPL